MKQTCNEFFNLVLEYEPPQGIKVILFLDDHYIDIPKRLNDFPKTGIIFLFDVFDQLVEFSLIFIHALLPSSPTPTLPKCD